MIASDVSPYAVRGAARCEPATEWREVERETRAFDELRDGRPTRWCDDSSIVEEEGDPLFLRRQTNAMRTSARRTTQADPRPAMRRASTDEPSSTLAAPSEPCSGAVEGTVVISTEVVEGVRDEEVIDVELVAAADVEPAVEIVVASVCKRGKRRTERTKATAQFFPPTARTSGVMLNETPKEHRSSGRTIVSSVGVDQGAVNM